MKVPSSNLKLQITYLEQRTFCSIGVRAYDYAKKFQPSKLLSTNDRIGDQLKIQSCEVIGWK